MFQVYFKKKYEVVYFPLSYPKWNGLMAITSTYPITPALTYLYLGKKFFLKNKKKKRKIKSAKQKCGNIKGDTPFGLVNRDRPCIHKYEQKGANKFTGNWAGSTLTQITKKVGSWWLISLNGALGRAPLIIIGAMKRVSVGPSCDWTKYEVL